MGLSVTLAGASMAQHGRVAHWAPQQHTPPPPRSQPRPQQAPQQHTPPPRSQPRPQQAPQQHQPPKNAGNPSQQGNRPNGGGGNPQGNGANRPNFVPRPSLNPHNNPNRPPSSYTPPPARRFSDLPPQEKQRVLENNNRYRNLPPAQRQELQRRQAIWNGLTPRQQDHVRNDIMPKWKQMPADRRQAIRQRLSVLQNMPESARNQRLNDSNFTRGMSEEDKATLRDLSHMHVGAPDPPSE
jgi:hypothetical protein